LSRRTTVCYNTNSTYSISFFLYLSLYRFISVHPYVFIFIIKHRSFHLFICVYVCVCVQYIEEYVTHVWRWRLTCFHIVRKRQFSQKVHATRTPACTIEHIGVIVVVLITFDALEQSVTVKKKKMPTMICTCISCEWGVAYVCVCVCVSACILASAYHIPSLSRHQCLRSITIRVNAVVVEAERRRVCGATVALLYNIITTILFPLVF
jgi:hypothetical protein